MNKLLLCTVGTSLKQFIEAEHPKNETEAAHRLAALEPTDRRCGAEINSVAAMQRQDLLTPDDHIHLLLSDTKDGRYIGEILCRYFRRWFKKCDHTVIKGLTHEEGGRFGAVGLKNLVREAFRIYNDAHNQGLQLLINATGGYKAQISFVGLVGQAMQVPVYYLFEEFEEIIELPPMPVALDFRLWLEYFELFDTIEERTAIAAADPRLRNLPERLKVLFECEGNNVTLSYMGLLFHRLLGKAFARQKESILPPPRPEDQEVKTHLEGSGHIYQTPGLQEFINRLKDVPYVTRIATFYHNPDLAEPCSFRRDTKGRDDCIVATYSRSGHTVRMNVFLTSDDPRCRDAAIADLTQQFCER